MRQTYFVGLLFLLVSISGCHGVAGNVIPQSGPSMESIYDSMGTHKADTDVEHTHPKKVAIRNAATPITSSYQFQKLPNPELQLYVYPHFAGKEEIPIPGYYTTFTAYEKIHYALPSEIVH